MTTTTIISMSVKALGLGKCTRVFMEFFGPLSLNGMT
jgi:hypothetical protein